MAFGLAHRGLTGITSIGVDEVAYARGHRYATRVYQLDAGMRRLLHVSEGRSIKSFLRFFVMLKREGRRLNEDLLGNIRFVCSDMWRAYVRVIQKKLPGALHILDRYHIVEGLNGLVKLRFKKAFGFRTFTAIEVALYHERDDLPKPRLIHRFC